MAETTSAKRQRTSCSGVAAAALLLLIGVASLAVGAIPAEWRAQLAEYLTVVEEAAHSLGDRLLPLSVGGACLIAGLLTLAVVSRRAVTRRRKAGYLSADVSDPLTPQVGGRTPDMVAAIAPVSVYFDFENQPLPASQVTPFVLFLQERVKSLTGADHFDRFFYCDAYTYARSAAYQALKQYGFEAVDVSHTLFDDTAAQSGDAAKTGNLKNFVDFELALHAYHRALQSPTPQVIILITTDTDFIPLIRRLRALGHRVQVWGRSVGHEFKRLEPTLGIETVSLESYFPPRSSLVPDPPHGSSGKPTIQRKRPGSVNASIESLTGPAALERAITATVECFSATEQALRGHPTPAPSAAAALRARLGGLSAGKGGGNLLARLGYEDTEGYKGRNRVAFWLDQLKALGAVIDEEGTPLPREGDVPPNEAATLLFAFLQVDIAAAVAASRPPSGGAVSVVLVCEHVVGAATDADQEPIRRLRHLMRPDSNGYHLKHAQYLCQCAKQLGLVRFDALTNQRLLVATEGEGSP